MIIEYFFLPLITMLASIPVVVKSHRCTVVVGYFISITFILFCGLRWYAGADFATYIEIFNAVPSLSYLTMSALSEIHGETGFLVLISLYKNIGLNHPGLFFFLITLFSITLKFIFFSREVQQSALAIAIYLAFAFITFEFIQLRMGMSIALVGIGFMLLRQEKRLGFLLCLLLALNFHWVSIVALPAIFIHKVSAKPLFYLTTGVIFFVTLTSPVQFLLIVSEAINSSSYLLVKLVGYINNENYNTKVSFFSLIPLRHLFVVIISSYVVIRLKVEGKVEYYYKLYLLGVITAFLFLEVEIFYSRIQAVFDIVEPILLILIVDKLFTPAHRKYVQLVLLFMALIYFTYNLKSTTALFKYQAWPSEIIGS